MRHLSLISLLLLPFVLTAQQALPNNCDDPPVAQMELVSNGVRAQITTGGDLWWDGGDGRYLVAEDPDSLFTRPIATLFAGGLWLAGTDPGGGIKGAFQQYGRFGGQFDYGPGPLNTDGNSDSTCVNWDRLFPVTIEDVTLFQERLAAGGLTVDDVPQDILGWPGVGNPYFTQVHGFDLPDNNFELAPFWDENRDGVYNPFDGDYPAFCGDQAIWCVFNDAVLHRESNTPVSAQVEVHLLAYSYDTAPEDELFRTTFYDYTLFNRAQEDIIDLHAGLWLDFDLGCFTDDLIGTIPEHDLVYTYNIDEQDTDPCDQNYPNFTTPGVIQIAQVVNSSSETTPGAYSVGAYLDTPLGTPPAQMTEPNTAFEHYNYLRGQWRDGSPVIRNRLGLNQAGDTTLFMFDGGLDPDGDAWRACSVPLPFIRYNPIISTGPYTLQPGEKADFTIAMTTLFNVDYPDDECPDEAPIIASAQAVKTAYDDGCRRSDLTDTDELTLPFTAPLTVFPNPTTSRVNFLTNQNRTIRRAEIFDGVGRSLIVQTGNASTLEINLAAQGLAPGVYIYRVTDDAGRMMTGKVVLGE